MTSTSTNLNKQYVWVKCVDEKSIYQCGRYTNVKVNGVELGSGQSGNFIKVKSAQCPVVSIRLTLTRFLMVCCCTALNPRPAGGGQILPPLSNIRDNLRTT